MLIYLLINLLIYELTSCDTGGIGWEFRNKIYAVSSEI